LFRDSDDVIDSAARAPHVLNRHIRTDNIRAASALDKLLKPSRVSAALRPRQLLLGRKPRTGRATN